MVNNVSACYVSPGDVCVLMAPWCVSAPHVLSLPRMFSSVWFNGLRLRVCVFRAYSPYCSTALLLIYVSSMCVLPNKSSRPMCVISAICLTFPVSGSISRPSSSCVCVALYCLAKSVILMMVYAKWPSLPSSLSSLRFGVLFVVGGWCVCFLVCSWWSMSNSSVVCPTVPPFVFVCVVAESSKCVF